MSTLNATPGIPAPAQSAPTQSTASTVTVPSRSPARSGRPRISLRLIVLLALVAAPFLYFGYVILDQSLNGGVTKRGEFYEVDLKSLGYFPFDAAKDDLDNVPSRWRELDGKRVVLHGEMYDSDS